MLAHHCQDTQAPEADHPSGESAPLIAVNVPYLGSYSRSASPAIAYGVPAASGSRRTTSPRTMVTGLIAPPPSTPRSAGSSGQYANYSRLIEGIRSMLVGLFSGIRGSYDYTGGYPAISGRRYPGLGVSTSVSPSYQPSIDDSPYSPTYRGPSTVDSPYSPTYRGPSSESLLSPTYRGPSSESLLSPTYRGD